MTIEEFEAALAAHGNADRLNIWVNGKSVPGKLTRKPEHPTLLFIKTKAIFPVPDLVVAISAIAGVERFTP